MRDAFAAPAVHVGNEHHLVCVVSVPSTRPDLRTTCAYLTGALSPDKARHFSERIRTDSQFSAGVVRWFSLTELALELPPGEPASTHPGGTHVLSVI